MTRKNNHKVISICDPERWGLNYETQKRQWYFKLRSDFFNDPQIFPLKSDEKILFLEILMHSLRVSKQSFSYCLEYASGLLRCSLDDIKGMLMELEYNDFIKLQTKVRRQYIEKNSIVENSIEQNRISDKPKAQVSSVLHLEHINNYFGDALDLPEREWLSCVKKKTLDKYFDTYCKDFLVEEIENAFEYNNSLPKSKKKKAVGLFLTGWFERSKREDKLLKPKTFESVLGDFFVEQARLAGREVSDG